MAEIGKYKKGLLNETNAQLVNARKKKSKRRFLFFFILFITLIGGFIYFAWYPKFLIKNSYVEGNRVLSDNKLQASVNEYLDGRFVYILPNRNAFIFNSEDLKNFLVKKHPTIKTIDVTQKVPDDLFIKVTERQPHALWCNAVPSDCFFIDSMGYAYDNAPYFSKPLFTVYELPGAELTKNVLDQKAFDFSQKIVNGLYTRGALVQKVKPMGDGLFQFDIILKNQINITSVTTNLSIGYEETISRIVSLLDSDDVLKHSNTNLNKIDVRYGNQVVYTFY
jgi:hypothetical protein